MAFGKSLLAMLTGVTISCGQGTDSSFEASQWYTLADFQRENFLCTPSAPASYNPSEHLGSKLDYITEQLHANPDVIIVNKDQRNYLSNRNKWGRWSETVDFTVAPRTGLYMARELQHFMVCLVPGLSPTMQDNYWEYPAGLTLGVLYFDEKISEQQVIEKISDPALLPHPDYPKGKRIKQSDLERGIWVSVFPNERVAHAILTGELPSSNQYEINRETLERYR